MLYIIAALPFPQRQSNSELLSLLVKEIVNSVKYYFCDQFISQVFVTFQILKSNGLGRAGAQLRSRI